MGDRILSVKDELREWSDLDLLAELLERFDQIQGVRQKALAMAVGVAPSRVTKWRKMVEGKNDVTLNRETRDEILSLISGEAHERSDGIEWAISEMKDRVEDLEETLFVRRELGAFPMSSRLRSEDLDALEQTMDEAEEPSGEETSGGNG